MIEHPFAKRRSPQELGPNNRRSTRVEFVSPIVVSGRDARGQVFREETETSIVNLHGCKLKMSHQILVGMVVTLETRHAPSPAKAICVHVWDPPRGETLREAAVQLLRPQNIWGLENPPPDWQKVLEALVQGLPGVGVTAPRPADLPAQAPPGAPAPAAPDRAAAPPVPAQVSKPVAAAPVPAPAPARAAVPKVLSQAAPPAPVAPKAAPAAAPGGDSHLAELEDRSWQLMDSVLQVLRDQTEELVRGTLEEFREQVEALVRDAESRLKQRADESYAGVESSINTLRHDLTEQLNHRTEEIVESAKKALQVRVGEMFSTMLSSSQNKPPSK
jgi:vacuolar-type H+-ATPase subunit H